MKCRWKTRCGMPGEICCDFCSNDKCTIRCKDGHVGCDSFIDCEIKTPEDKKYPYKFSSTAYRNCKCKYKPEKHKELPSYTGQLKVYEVPVIYVGPEEKIVKMKSQKQKAAEAKKIAEREEKAKIKAEKKKNKSTPKKSKKSSDSDSKPSKKVNSAVKTQKSSKPATVSKNTQKTTSQKTNTKTKSTKKCKSAVKKTA